MKNKLLLVILLCLLFIPLVNAETLTGSVGSSGIVSTNYIMGYTVGGQNDAIYWAGEDCLTTKAIEYNTGSTALVHFDDTGHPSGYANTANISGVCPVTGKVGTATIFTGNFGYFRNFNFLGTEIEGYQYYTFSNWNSSGLTGAQDIKIYNNGSCGLLQVTGSRTNNNTQFVSGLLTMGRSSYYPGGYYTYNKNIDFFNEYTVTKPSGIGIAGYVTKTIGGTAYSSKVHILNGTSGVQLQADQYANTNQFNISTNAESIRINIYSSGGIWYNTSQLFNVSVIPTPTPTPSLYSISTSSDSFNMGDSITGTLLYNGVAVTNNLTVSGADWTYRKTGESFISHRHFLEYPSLTKELSYSWNETKWNGYDSAYGLWNNDKGASFPNALTLFPYETGSVIISCMVYTTSAGAPIEVTKTVTIAGADTTFALVIHAIDWVSGSSIGESTISIKNKNTNIWSNLTTASDGYRSVRYAADTPLRIEASATGYISAGIDYNVVGNDFINIQLYKTGTGETNVSLSTLLVRTFQQNDLGQIQPLSGVLITLNDGQAKTTYSGTAQFTINNNSYISIDAFKTGYLSATKTVYANSSLTTATLYLFSTTSTVNPTPFPTPTVTPYPTQTPSGTLTTCKNTMPTGSTVTDIMFNNIACWGITDLEGQNLTFAGLIILICALILGKIGKGDGAIIGGIIGFIISFARHLIPFYLLVLAFIIIGAYFAQKLIGGK